MFLLTLLVGLSAFEVQAGAGHNHAQRYGYNHNYAPVNLQQPVYNARAGPVGTPWMSPYFLGLRGGQVNHQLQDYNTRYQISSSFYPQERIYGPVGWREYSGKPRLGGYYGNQIGSFSGVTFGDFVFTGR